MRHWLLFLLLFCLGLAALLWVQARQDARRAREQQQREAEAPRPVGPEPGAPVPDELASKLQDKEGQVGEVEVRGRVQDRQLDPEKGPLYEFLSENVFPVGEDAYDLERVEARRWDPVSRALRLELHSSRGRARLKSGRKVTLDVDYPVTLETVEATIHEGPRFVPLTARVPVLEGVLATEHFTSRERVDIEGRGLVASGTGLDYDGLAARIELLRDTHVELELEGGAKAVLDADAGLVIAAADPGGPPPKPEEIETVEITARSAARRARLDFGGARPFAVEADEIRLFGHIPPGEERRFVTTRALALGHVRVVPRSGTFSVDGVFLGERADFEFNEDGLPTRATLEQEPVVELLLRDAGAVRLPGEPALPPGGLPATVTGTGPLALEFEPEPGFVFGGPAELAVPDLAVVLNADDSLTGRRSGSDSVVIATGNAVARRGDAVVRCDEIVLRAETGADGRTLGRLITEQPTVATSLLPQGEAVLDALDGLEYLYSESLERLVEARGVTLVVSGPDAFEARARTVRDFDPRASSFVAQGDVTFENELGTGQAERVDGYSRTHVELTGAPDAPARYELPGGFMRAYSIEYEGERVTARGDVTAELETAGRAHTFAGRWMVATRTPLPASDTEPAGRERLDLSAGGAVRASVREGDEALDLAADRLEAAGLIAAEAAAPGASSKLEPLQLSAFGSVVFDHRSRGPDGEVDLHGEGARLDVDGLGRGKLLPAPPLEGAQGQGGDGKVRFSGSLPARGVTFEMTARDADFSPERLVATDVDADIRGIGVSLSGDPTSDERAPLRAVAGRMSADRRSLLLSESAYLGQTTAGPNTWTLDAERILITGDPDAPPLPADVPGSDLPLHELLAWGGFRATLDDSITAEGIELHAERASELLEMKGAPASISTAALTWTSEWFEWNVRTGFLESGQGRLQSAPAAPTQWEVSYESLEPIVGADSTIQVLRELKATSGDKQLYAAWALFWVDSNKWAGVSAQMMTGEITPETVAAPMARFGKGRNNLFALFEESGISEWLKEAYLEGNIEIRTLRTAAPGEDPLWERTAGANAAYFDLTAGIAWVHDAVMAGSMSIGGRSLKMKVRADWLRHSSDGAFEAERAVATTCDFEDPHYEIEVGDLLMDPRIDPEEQERAERQAKKGQTSDEPAPPPPTDGWNITTKNTGVNLPDIGVRMPLPPVSFPLTDDFQVPREEIKLFGLQPLSFGSDARFGTFVALSFALPLGPVSYAVGRVLDKAMGNQPKKIDGDWSFRPAYFGSRGFGMNVGHTLESKGRFIVENDLALINDTGDDKGLVRVPEDERESLRLWYRMRSRFLLDPGEWLDVVITTQTDPGVQAEFFQDDFLEFEERETYAHWRKAEGLDYYYGTAEVRLDSFRTEVVDQPTLGYYRAPGSIATLWGRPLNYTSNTEVGRLLREEGDPDFEDPFPDGLGERDVVRADTTHRIERPAPLGLLGILATPYLEARGTVWDEGTGPGSTPLRAALLAGLELGTSFWRLFESGALHAWSPTLGVRSDVLLEEDGQVPVSFDEVENSLDGTFVDVGVRSRWNLPRKGDEVRRFLDLEVRETYATSTDTVDDEGWQPVRVNAAYLTSVFGVPAGVTHDGRYDVQTSDTPYSRTYFGVQPIPELVIETGYHSGRDPDGELVYNAISLGGRYTFSEKWQIEGEQTVSTTRDRLSSALALRRIGHDYVFEVELSFQAGEGGSSLHFSLDPLFLYDPPSLGLLDRWSKE